jgi:hypothetical protein
MEKRFLYSGITILIFAFMLLFSCPDPAEDSGKGNPPPSPDNVNVTRDGSNLIVTWNPVREADEYEVLRRYGGNGQFASKHTTTSTLFIDIDFDNTKQIQYGVKSLRDGMASTRAESNIISNHVQNITARLFKSTNSISLTWNVHPEDPDSYRIYRYTSKTPGETPVLLGEVTTNYFTDGITNPIHLPLADTAYFYRVTWVMDGIDYGEDVPFVFGVFSSRIDNSETGDDKEDAKAISKNTPMLMAYIYSFGDGIGGVEADIDWYKYVKPVGVAEMVCLVVHLPADGSLDGKLKIKKCDGPHCMNDEGEALYYYAGGQECFLNLSSASDTGYFEIFPTFGSGSSVIKEYSIELK